MSSGVFAYGAPPRPLAPPRDTQPVITTPEGTFKLPDGTAIFVPPLAPCPKCKRHIKDSECPFCYADSLKPESMNAELASLRAKTQEAIEARDAAYAEAELLRVEHKHMLDNLTATQARCTELIQETRKLRRQKLRFTRREAMAIRSAHATFFGTSEWQKIGDAWQTLYEEAARIGREPPEDSE